MSKEYIDELNREIIDYQIEVEQVKVENTKLRKLVRAMWLYDYEGKFSSAQEDVEHVAMVYQCMRELGVDV